MFSLKTREKNVTLECELGCNIQMVKTSNGVSHVYVYFFNHDALTKSHMVREKCSDNLK